MDFFLHSDDEALEFFGLRAVQRELGGGGWGLCISQVAIVRKVGVLVQLPIGQFK